MQNGGNIWDYIPRLPTLSSARSFIFKLLQLIAILVLLIIIMKLFINYIVSVNTVIIIPQKNKKNE